jgi:hypothetical protein
MFLGHVMADDTTSHCTEHSVVTAGEVDPDTIVIALDVSEQAAPCSIAIGVFAMVILIHSL